MGNVLSEFGTIVSGGAGGGGSSTLAGLTDVAVTSPQDGEGLIYDSTLHVWKNGQGIAADIVALEEDSPATATHAINSHLVYTNIIYKVIATIAIGDSLVVGTNIEEATIPEGTTVFYDYNIPFSATIAVTYPEGATCTCTGNGQSQTADTNPYTFTVHAAATYTITATDGGDTASDTVTITTDGQSESVALSFVPEGSTVTPTDDIQTWLACGGVTGKSYTTLNEVLTDTSTLYTLIYGNNNANDYLVRSTTWASDACANEDFMTYVGSDNYAANLLIANATWLAAIANSTYIEKVLKGKVPTMTDNTHPEGVVSGQSTGNPNSSSLYLIFNGQGVTILDSTTSTTAHLQYQFPSDKVVKVAKVKFPSGLDRSGTLTTSGVDSSDNLTTLDTYSYTASDASTTKAFPLTNTTAFPKYRVSSPPMYESGSYYKVRLELCQFYYRIDV